MASLAVPAAEVSSANPLLAIIDIGSNSIRLVVYNGLSRTPAVLFNEKMMAGLGRAMGADGKLSREAIELALPTLARFRLLCDAMGVDSLRAVATAAVREAKNGPAFIRRIREETGIDVEIIDGATEAVAAAMGVIAGIPDAEGVVGDLGGGSLELVRIAGGEVLDRVSLPLGALKLDALRKKSRRTLSKRIEKCLQDVSWASAGKGLPFYAVGGSWRALAHLHMHMTDWPLPVIHQYQMPADAPDRIVRSLARMTVKSLKDIPAISSSRAPQLPGAAALLRAVIRRLGSSHIVTSAYGLREGLLFESLPPEARRQDPLLNGARETACRLGRFSDVSDIEGGDALMAFIDPLFISEPPPIRRIRHAAAMLADSSWRAHPDMRAEDGMDIALHGNWAGIDAAGRAMLAAALWTVNGGAASAPGLAILARLAEPESLTLARQWGLALRLGQRLGGGAAAPLATARLARQGGALVLRLSAQAAPLYGEPVARRHRTLAQALGLEARLITG